MVFGLDPHHGIEQNAAGGDVRDEIGEGEMWRRHRTQTQNTIQLYNLKIKVRREQRSAESGRLRSAVGYYNVI